MTSRVFLASMMTAAGRIIDHRPYSDSEDLVKRHVISRAEYNRIAGKIEAR